MLIKIIPFLLLLICSHGSIADDNYDTQAEIEALKQRIQELESQNNNNSKAYEKPSNKSYSSERGSSNYIRGPRGGCYTFSASGCKKYVDRSLCN